MEARSRTFARCAALLAAIVLVHAPAFGFSLDDVTARAEKLAKQDYVDHRGVVPKWMLVGSMTYDQWRDIRFRPDQALWRSTGLPFQVQFFHPGLYYDRTVRVNVVEPDGVRRVPFSTSLFDYGKNDFADRIPKDIGFAGLRIHAPFKNPDYYDEVIVFLGATYFRAVGRDQVWGLSARGIAIDTVESQGEEFPHFTEFWLVTPKIEAKSIVVYALMEGPSITGAYRFEVTPGEQTTADVEERLFPRKPIDKLGIAPLTSMFFFGENTTRCFDDFRPEVHDSDGLLLHFPSGEWLWRPLQNPTRINASSFHMRDPSGFGLLQRDRDFADYQDIETRSELRPSAWVEPHGSWGEGRVELDEIPTTSELVDNIVTYWVPDAKPQPGQRLDYAYRVSFYGDDPQRPPGGRTLATRRDNGTVEGGGGRRFVVDFQSSVLDSLGPDQPPEAVLSAGPDPDSAEILDHHLVKNPSTHGWRLTFQLKPKGDVPVELRAFLKKGDDVLTETWSYTLLP